MREIVPSLLYTSLSKTIAERKELNVALAALFWALRNKADDFPVIPGYQTLRLAKTDAVRNIPALYLLFRISTDDKVQLVYIEVAGTNGFQGPPIL